MSVPWPPGQLPISFPEEVFTPSLPGLPVSAIQFASFNVADNYWDPPPPVPNQGATFTAGHWFNSRGGPSAPEPMPGPNLDLSWMTALGLLGPTNGAEALLSDLTYRYTENLFPGFPNGAGWGKGYWSRTGVGAAEITVRPVAGGTQWQVYEFEWGLVTRPPAVFVGGEFATWFWHGDPP